MPAVQVPLEVGLQVGGHRLEHVPLPLQSTFAGLFRPIFLHLLHLLQFGLLVAPEQLVLRQLHVVDEDLLHHSIHFLGQIPRGHVRLGDLGAHDVQCGVEVQLLIVAGHGDVQVLQHADHARVVQAAVHRLQAVGDDAEGRRQGAHEAVELLVVHVAVLRDGLPRVEERLHVLVRHQPFAAALNLLKVLDDDGGKELQQHGADGDQEGAEVRHRPRAPAPAGARLHLAVAAAALVHQPHPALHGGHTEQRQAGDAERLEVGVLIDPLTVLHPSEQHHPDVGIDEEHQDEQRAHGPEGGQRQHDGRHQALHALQTAGEAGDARDARDARDAGDARQAAHAQDAQEAGREEGEREVHEGAHHQRKVKAVPPAAPVGAPSEREDLHEHLDEEDEAEDQIERVQEAGVVGGLVVVGQHHEHGVHDDAHHDEGVERGGGDDGVEEAPHARDISMAVRRVDAGRELGVDDGVDDQIPMLLLHGQQRVVGLPLELDARELVEHHAGEEVHEGEADDADEDDEVDEGDGVGVLLRRLVHTVARVQRRVQHPDPLVGGRHREKRQHALADVVKVEVEVLPIAEITVAIHAVQGLHQHPLHQGRAA
mmetsp:Transcript_35131/g.59127  ORF Transcript_35131/g.59127 Transcript_35131/m.59127 type:complete len:596 (+) Transcript_35131:2013-3800(+)